MSAETLRELARRRQAARAAGLPLAASWAEIAATGAAVDASDALGRGNRRGNRARAAREAESEARRRLRDETRAQFAALCATHGLPRPVPEFRFDPVRRWAIDYAFPEQRVALEVEGGVYTRGRHVRPTGFLGDMRKYNRLAELGWRLVRVTPNALCTLDTLAAVRAALTHTSES
jgi:very-short-patch-repair endonuclease